MAMVTSYQQTPGSTTPSMSPNYTLELDFPWLVGSSSTPSLQPQALPTGAGPEIDFANSWSPIRGMENMGGFADTTTGTPSSDYSSPGGSPATSPGSQLTQGSSGYHSLGSPSSGSDTSAPSPQPPARGSAGKPTSPATKPNASYIEMIAKALISAPGQKMLLQDMYAYIQQQYPYYQTAQATWKNSVRHNLCVNECFMKAGRSNSSRGFYWTIHPACLDMFSRGDFGRMKAKRLAQKMYKSIRAATESSSGSTAKVASPPGVTYSAAKVVPPGPMGAYGSAPAVTAAMPTVYAYGPSASIYTPQSTMVNNVNSSRSLQQPNTATFSDYRMSVGSLTSASYASSSRLPGAEPQAPYYYHPYSGYHHSSQGVYPTSAYPTTTSYPVYSSTPATTAPPTYDHSTTYNSYYSQGTGSTQSSYQMMTVPRFM